jgi:hypothetical protein
MVYRLTGMLAWVFGPASSCPTYSKCWFGVLACGKPQLERIDEKQMIGFLDTFYHNYTRLPARRNGWTIRSLYMHMRVIGAEIIVPEQRVATVAGGDDVIIAQYVTTKTYSPSIRDLYRLEIRQEEYYPAVLYGFTDFETEKLGTLGQFSMACCYLHWFVVQVFGRPATFMLEATKSGADLGASVHTPTIFYLVVNNKGAIVATVLLDLSCRFTTNAVYVVAAML